MKYVLRTLLAIVFSVIFIAAARPLVVSALDANNSDPYNNLCGTATANNGGDAPSACSPATTNPVSGNDSILMKAVNIVSMVAGVVAVVMLMINGVKIMTSMGDSNKFTQARNSIIFIAVGIVIIVLARTIISFILNRI